MPAERFAEIVVERLLRSSPPRVIRRGTHSFKAPLLKRWLPSSLVEAKLSRLFGLDTLR
jgi:hypothetical protein